MKFEATVYSFEDFFYGEKKDQPGCTLWIALQTDPRPLRISVFGKTMVEKAHAYAQAKKAVLTIVGNNQLNPVVTLA